MAEASAQPAATFAPRAGSRVPGELDARPVKLLPELRPVMEHHARMTFAIV